MNRQEEKATQQKDTHVAFSSEEQFLPKWNLYRCWYLYPAIMR